MKKKNEKEDISVEEFHKRLDALPDIKDEPDDIDWGQASVDGLNKTVLEEKERLEKEKLEQEKKKARNKWKVAIILLGIVVIVASFILYDTFYSKGGSFGLPYGNGATFYDNGNYVSAGGSWVSDSENGIISEQPINTAEINCFQSRGFCTEGRAYKAKKGTENILAQILEYEIKSWTPQDVVAVLDARAGTIEIRFDRIKKIVTMTESEKAEIEGARVLPAYAHLGGGQEAMNASRK